MISKVENSSFHDVNQSDFKQNKNIINYIYERSIDVRSVINNHRKLIFIRASILLISDISSLFLSIFLGAFSVTIIRTILQNKLAAFKFYEINIETSISLLIMYIFLIFWFFLKGRYTNRDPLYRHNFNAIKGSFILLLSSGLIQYLLQDTVSRIWLVLTSIFTAILLIFSWSFAVSFMRYIGIWSTPIFIVGDKAAAEEIQRMCLTQISLGYVVAGQFDPSLIDQGDEEYSDLVHQCALQTNFQEFEIVISPSINQFDNALRLSKSLETIGISNLIHSPLNLSPFSQLRQITPFGLDIILFSTYNNLAMFSSRLLKRFIDIIISLSLIVIMLPFLIVISVIIKSDGGPIIYRSNRLGYKCQPFQFLKFRSMVNNADSVLKELLKSDPALEKHYSIYLKLPNDPRVTSFGRFLRKYSIDELPQLFNVLMGQMSLVGPRPILPNEVVLYEDLRFYSSVRPGITGLWQIAGRSDLSFGDRVALDERYVRTWSVKNDFVILVKTVRVVLTGQGAY